MGVLVCAALAALGVALVCVIHRVRCWISTRLRNAPPIVTGWLPFIGCMREFASGKGPAWFLRECKEKYGNVFTIHVGGRYMTFVMDYKLYPTYFNSSEDIVDFQKATQPFLTQGFGVSAQAYFTDHNNSLNCIRSKLLPANLSKFYTENLMGQFKRAFKEDWGESGVTDLQESIRKAVFWGSSTCLFGDLRHHADLIDVFETFDQNFELASSDIPHVFLRQFVKSKSQLLSVLGELSKLYDEKSPHEGGDKMILGKEILNSLTDKNPSSWLLAILWAAEANTIPAIFWILSFLLSDRERLKRVVDEIDQKASENDSGELTEYSEVHSLEYLRCCVQEALRLRSAPIILRKTLQPVPFGSYTVPAGHFLCLSPLWAHRDANLYENPDEFVPERWIGKDENVGGERFAYIAFGGGKYRCPGKFFAYHEMLMFISTLLRHYELEMLDPMPAPNWINLVGVQKPVGDCKVSYKQRQWAS